MRRANLFTGILKTKFQVSFLGSYYYYLFHLHDHYALNFKQVKLKRNLQMR